MKLFCVLLMAAFLILLAISALLRLVYGERTEDRREIGKTTKFDYDDLYCKELF